MDGKYGKDLKVGDFAYGRLVLALKQYQVPAKILHESVARQHPEGLPAYFATLAPTASSPKIEVTIFFRDIV